jgi:hypothetical protein
MTNQHTDSVLIQQMEILKGDNTRNNETIQPWEVPTSERVIGVECLAFHRGKWVHVRWSDYGWSLGAGKAFLPGWASRPFAPLPIHASATPDFYGWE